MSVLMKAVENASSSEVVKLLLDHNANVIATNEVQYSHFLTMSTTSIRDIYPASQHGSSY
jgi:ankyrin repeat protein